MTKETTRDPALTLEADWQNIGIDWGNIPRDVAAGR